MKRIVYYIVHASSEENQNGVFHFSEPYSDLATVRKAAKNIRDDFRDDNVVIEKHHEVYDRWEWRPDHDLGDDWMERVEDL